MRKTRLPLPSARPAAASRPSNHDTRLKQRLTALGAVEFQRAYYLCPHGRRGQGPRDAELDVAGCACSPGEDLAGLLANEADSFKRNAAA